VQYVTVDTLPYNAPVSMISAYLSALEVIGVASATDHLSVAEWAVVESFLCGPRVHEDIESDS
jgi:hypothetical protein